MVQQKLSCDPIRLMLINPASIPKITAWHQRVHTQQHNWKQETHITTGVWHTAYCMRYSRHRVITNRCCVHMVSSIA